MPNDPSQSAPIMTIDYFSPNNIFVKIEDIYRSQEVIGTTPTIWLKITKRWTWPGPNIYLDGEAEAVSPRVGIKAICERDIAVDIRQAFSIAWEFLQITGSDCFNGSITLEWDSEFDEPLYRFSFSPDGTVFVGAFTGEVSAVA
jgi:hypothetical protein